MARSDGAPPAGELTHLEEEARILTLRREVIQRQVNEMFSGRTLGQEQLALLNRLEEQEREVSAQRRKLHQRIAHLRAGLGLPQHQRRPGAK
jgi:chromosome segregation ATPase